MKVFNKRDVPFLNEKMKYKQATNMALSVAAGVSDHTVQKARNGEAILYHLAECIEQALTECSFQYKKRGPKKGTTWTRRKV